MKTMTLYDARIKFSIRSKMVKTILVTPSTVPSYGTAHIVTGWTVRHTSCHVTVTSISEVERTYPVIRIL